MTDAVKLALPAGPAGVTVPISVQGAAGLDVGWYSNDSEATRTLSVAVAASVMVLLKCVPSAAPAAPEPTARVTAVTAGADVSAFGAADTSPLRALSTPPVVEVSW